MASVDQVVLQFVQLSTRLSAKVHPLVIFNICDCFVRRPDQAQRVIRTLLGSVLPDGTVDIRNYIMNPPIRFSTGCGITGGSALIHEFYSREVTNPVHLTVDTGFTSGEASIKAFVSINLSLGDQQLAAQFQQVALDLCMLEAERVGFDIFKTTAVEKLPSDLDGMEAIMELYLC